MKTSRRKFLKIIGGGTIVATAGIGGFVSTRTPHKAQAPWFTAGTYGDPRKWALSYALLAPNPHNRQPWEVDLSTPDQVTIFRDKSKDLPQTDPYSRQLTIGMGCFLELLRIAASQKGFDVKYDLFPDGDAGPIAIAKFTDGTKPDTLFAHVMDRRSCKEPFSDKLVTNVQAEKLASFAKIITDQPMVETVKKLTWDAWLTEANTPLAYKESVDLMRMGKAEINANPDGIDLGGPFLESLMLVGALTREAQMDKNSTSYKQGINIYEEMLHATPAYAYLTSEGNSRVDQIKTGMKWLRLNLKTTAMGLSLHPVSQALQEFDEMAVHYNNVHKLLAKNGETVQMLGRLGYGPVIPKTPRWPLETRIKKE